MALSRFFAPHRAARAVVSGLTIRREGWCYLGVISFVFVGALIRDINLLMLLFGMLAGPLVYSVWYGWFALRRVEARRVLPSQVHAGEPFEVAIELTNHRRWFGVWAIVVGDTIQKVGGRVAPRDAGVMFFYVAAGKTLRISYQAQLMERGDYEFGPLTVSTRFPLGLFRRSLSVGNIQTLIVWPRLGRLQNQTRALARHAEQFSHQQQRERGLVEGDFYGVRDWRAGDSRRWIHWRTSARMGELMVRQFERSRTPDLVVLVDLWLPAQASIEDVENVELATSFAGTLVADACRKGGAQITLGIACQENRVLRGSTTSKLYEAALDALAAASAIHADRLHELFLQVAPLQKPGARTILITTRAADPAQNAALAAVAPDGRARQWLSQMTTLTTSDPELPAYFLAE